MISLPLRYALFALLSMGGNLALQHGVTDLYGGPFALTAAMMVGTGGGLVIKYVLDKRWIFADVSRGVAAHTRTFTLYTLTGVFTTALFWGLEYGADALPPHGHYRYAGAILGLSIGYVVKFRLDRRFVFSSPVTA